MSYFDHTYGTPIIREMNDEALMDEAVAIEVGDTALTEWMTDADAEYIRSVVTEAKARGLWERVQELAAVIREADHMDTSRYTGQA